MRTTPRFRPRWVLPAILVLSATLGCSLFNWPQHYSVTYLANGATSGSVPVDSTSYTAGDRAVLRAKGSLEREGYTFVGWNEAQDGSSTSLSPGLEVAVTGDLRVYAQWSKIETPVSASTYSVLYKSNGADSGDVPVDDSSYLKDGVIFVRGNLGHLQLAGHSFAGWSTQESGGTLVEANSTLGMPLGGLTLYAQWEEASAGIVYTLDTSTGKAVAQSYQGSATTLTIPSRWEGYAVASLGPSFAQGFGTMTTVYAPASLETFSANSFKDSGVTDIYLRRTQGLTTLTAAFQGKSTTFHVKTSALKTEYEAALGSWDLDGSNATFVVDSF